MSYSRNYSYRQTNSTSKPGSGAYGGKKVYNKSGLFGGNASAASRTGSQSYQKHQGSGTKYFRQDTVQDKEYWDAVKQQAAKIESEIWHSTMTLVRLPGNYPVCYATGRGSHLVTSYTAWSNYKSAVNSEAWSRAKNEASESDKQHSAPFTWGFRSFPSGEAFAPTGTEPSRAGAWLWDFVQANILPFDTPRKKFLRGLQEIAKRNKAEAQLNLVLQGLKKGNTQSSPAAVNALLGFLIFPKDESLNYSPKELSEFYNESKEGDEHTSNLLFDQVGLRKLEARQEKLSQDIKKAKASAESGFGELRPRAAAQSVGQAPPKPKKKETEFISSSDDEDEVAPKQVAKPGAFINMKGVEVFSDVGDDEEVQYAGQGDDVIYVSEERQKPPKVGNAFNRDRFLEELEKMEAGAQRMSQEDWINSIGPKDPN